MNYYFMCHNIILPHTKIVTAKEDSVILRYDIEVLEPHDQNGEFIWTIKGSKQKGSGANEQKLDPKINFDFSRQLHDDKKHSENIYVLKDAFADDSKAIIPEQSLSKHKTCENHQSCVQRSVEAQYNKNMMSQNDCKRTMQKRLRAYFINFDGKRTNSLEQYHLDRVTDCLIYIFKLTNSQIRDYKHGILDISFSNSEDCEHVPVEAPIYYRDIDILIDSKKKSGPEIQTKVPQSYSGLKNSQSENKKYKKKDDISEDGPEEPDSDEFK